MLKRTFMVIDVGEIIGDEDEYKDRIQSSYAEVDFREISINRILSKKQPYLYR